MFMTAGSAFTGRNGKAYSTSGQVDGSDVALALKAGWQPSDPGDLATVAATLPTGSTNDHSPAGLSSSTVRMEYTANSAGSTLTGLAAGEDNQQVMIVNLGTGALTLSHQSASSMAQNRFLAGADVTVAASGGCVLLQYSATQQRWLVR